MRERECEKSGGVRIRVCVRERERVCGRERECARKSGGGTVRERGRVCARER